MTYYNIKEIADKLPTDTSSRCGAGESDAGHSLPRLPKIEIFEFSGDLRDWETFYSIFKSLIHDNKALFDVDKVYYLVGRLKGSALVVCSGVAPTGGNYSIIWNALVDRYQDKKSLANSYFNQIMDFKRLQGESSKNLELFLEKFDSAVKALKNLKVNDLTALILVHVALIKLDPETIKTFDMLKRGSDIPKYEELITFVKEPSKILSNRKPIVSKVNSDNKFKSKSFVDAQYIETN
ncbi:unnamed protein product [Psylliodes chrysocephalus]|uniref:Gag protein n=1 Tax=Psylliodes chrysocephalus TaxID=3402493 RepID=A0A9P0D376_9CUCU|nr:unnamed protein product [Psylliodes chrysocephala]